MQTNRLISILLMFAAGALAQQSSAPIRKVTALPATCSVGQVVFLTTPTTGIRECTATNTWTTGPAGAVGATGATGPTGSVSGTFTTNVIPRASSSSALVDGGITDDGTVLSAAGRSTYSLGTGAGTPPAGCCGFYAVTSGSASYMWGRAAGLSSIAALNLIGQKANGTIASPTDTAANSLFYFMAARGYVAASGGYSSSSKAAITMIAGENWNSAANGTFVTLETTPNGTTTRFEQLRVCDNGNVVVFQGTALGGYGTACSGGYRFDVLRSGANGTAHFQDTTATTGFTRVVIDLGAADTASTETSTNNGASAATAFRSIGYAFASLPSPTNGTFVYCSDCDAGLAGATCASATTKTGAAAFRLNGSWKCF